MGQVHRRYTMLRFLGVIFFVIIIVAATVPLSGPTIVGLMVAGCAIGLVVGLIVRSINRRY